MASHYYTEAGLPGNELSEQVERAASAELASLVDGLDVHGPTITWWHGTPKRDLMSIPIAATVVERDLGPAVLNGWYEGGDRIHLVVPPGNDSRRAVAALRHFACHWYECRHLGSVPTWFTHEHVVCSTRAQAWTKSRPTPIELAVLSAQRVDDPDLQAHLDIWTHRDDSSPLGIAMTVMAHRRLARLTIGQLAGLSGVAAEDIDRYESGLLNPASIKQLCDIAAIFRAMYTEASEQAS